MDAQTSEHSTVFNIKEISKILPHRYPFLLVDRVIQLDLENNYIIGLKCLTINEQFFQGHFPDAPIMPGVLILEALAQVGGILIHEKGFKDKTKFNIMTKNGISSTLKLTLTTETHV